MESNMYNNKSRSTCILAGCLLLLLLAGCGGGGGSTATPAPIADTPPPAVDTPVDVPVVDVPPVVVVPPVVDVPPVVVEPPAPPAPPVLPPAPPALVQMSKPTECLTVASDTGYVDFPYITCDGIPTNGPTSYPFDEGNTEIALITVMAVVDTDLTLEMRRGLTVEEFVQKQFDFANDIFASSGVYIVLQVAGIVEIDVREGDLIKQYQSFTMSRAEFHGLDAVQDENEADFAFLFKARAEVPWACGVASLVNERDDHRVRRGVSQCHVGEEFNDTETTRYYERASITFTHEMGHLFGMEHNIESAKFTPLFPFSYGYLLPEYEVDKTDEWNGYGTVMSYSDKPTHKMSDPDATFEIPELGIVVPVGRYKNADAVRHLNRVRYFMSQVYEESQL